MYKKYKQPFLNNIQHTLIHHSDRGPQDLLIRYSGRLAEVGIESSVASRGDSCVYALAESEWAYYRQLEESAMAA